MSASQKAAQPTVIALQHVDFVWRTWFYRLFTRPSKLIKTILGHILAEISVFLIDNQDSGLWGAAFWGQQILHKG